MRTIKKIVALATGATMLGATIMGAMAADLADYPAPFVEGCTFSGAIVVGDAAAAEDVIGAVDISSTLAVSGTTTAGGAAAVSAVGEAVKIETSTDKLNIGNNLTAVREVALDDDDLPMVLSKETFTADDGDDFDYKQKITLTALEFAHWADSEYEDKAPTLGIRIPKGTLVATYKLDFTKSAESDVDTDVLEDIEDADITIMGKSYDITSAINSTLALELMGGSVKDILEQGQTKTYTLDGKDYEVEVTYIGATPEVKFKVNGELTDSLTEGETHKLADGTEIGVRDIMEEEAGEVTADMVEFYLGAEKLTLANGDEMQLNDEDVDNVDIVVDATISTTTKINYITIAWTADDDLFVTEDSEVVMPGLESFKLTYEGLTTVAAEELKIEDGGDELLQITANLEDGEYTIDLLGANLAGGFDAIGGDGDNEGLATVAATGVIEYDLSDGSEDQYFIATYDNGAKAGESYLLEVSKADADDGVDIKNVVTGELVAEELDNGSDAFSVGSAILTMDLFVEDDFVNISSGATTYFDRIITKEGLRISLPIDSAAGGASPLINISAAPAVFSVLIEEEDKDGTIGAGSTINVSVGFTTDNEVKVSGIDESILSGGSDIEIGDTDEFVGYVNSDLGTRTLVDSGPDQPTFSLTYYGEQAYGNVYVAETGATFAVAEAAGEAVCKVTVPPALLASEVSDVSAQNLILVGGPCANAAAASAMGVAGTVPECLAGFEEGKSKIKLYEQATGKVAMLVAGMTALDTRRAARVLKNYEDYALSGDEVEVTGTTLTDISVSAVTAE